MEKLWIEGVRMWDEFRRQYFTLRAIIFVTINDYPALLSLSGQIKGKTGCVVCLNGTAFLYLSSSSKVVYMRHRRFLSVKHKYRKLKECFDNTHEKDYAPIKCSGKLVFDMVKNIKVVFGKKTKEGKKRNRTMPPLIGVPFKKESIFYKYLPYWKDLEVQHAIDGMHLKKNVFDSTIGMLLDMPRKTKDGLKS